MPCSLSLSSLRGAPCCRGDSFGGGARIGKLRGDARWFASLVVSFRSTFTGSGAAVSDSQSASPTPSVHAALHHLSRTIMYSGVGLVAATVLCGFQDASSFLAPALPAVAPAVSRQHSTQVSMAANEQLPADAKRYYVRPDRILDVVTSAPQLLLRLGSGALVDGYRCEYVSTAQLLLSVWRNYSVFMSLEVLCGTEPPFCLPRHKRSC